jgi:2-keto-3-deoxy-6-phosphogluconate aldolase
MDHTKNDNRRQITHRILSEKLMAIVRLPDCAYVEKSIACLVDGGIQVLEITSYTIDF